MRERFDSLVYPDPNSGCFLWGASCDASGYGQFKVRLPGTLGPRRNMRAHVVAWFLAGRALPPDMLVLHKCDLPCCVNVDHLFLGTHADNRMDMMRKGRGRKSASGLPYGVVHSASRFGARFALHGRHEWLGTFATMEEAAAVATAAKLAYLEELQCAS